MLRSHFIIAVLFSALLVSACEGNSAKSILGIQKKSPDEFMVLSHPPLSLPPDFSLRPPGEAGAPALSSSFNPTSLSSAMDQTTYQALPTGDIKVESAITPGETSLLSKAGIVDADPNIRQLLEADSRPASGEEPEEPGFLGRLHKRLNNDMGEEPLVDPIKEKERIEKNKLEGKSILEGETPVNKPEDKSVIDNLFKL